jgi:hypothetical protein
MSMRLPELTPCFCIHMINSEFESFEESDYPSLDAARQAAISTAKVAAESVWDGATSAAVELQIRDGHAIVARHLVTLTVSDLGGGES